MVGSRKRDCQNENSPFLLPPGGTKLCSNFEHMIFMQKSNFEQPKFENIQNCDYDSDGAIATNLTDDDMMMM